MTALDPVLARFRDAILQATASRAPLTLRGSCTKDFYGRARFVRDRKSVV